MRNSRSISPMRAASVRAPATAVRALTASSLALGLALAACVADLDTSAWQRCTDGTLCPAGTTCSQDGASCLREHLCGDGKADPDEECDDHNATNGDGCDNNCKLTRCGNGVVTAGEICDDGNVNDGDGCSPTCTRPVCGDCVVSPGEECDDGNVNDSDGCDSDCRLTPGRALSGPADAGPSCPAALR